MEVSSFQRVLCYVQAPMELSWGLKMCPYYKKASSIGTKLKCPDYGGVLISEGVVLCTGSNGVELGPECVVSLSLRAKTVLRNRVQNHLLHNLCPTTSNLRFPYSHTFIQ